MFFKRIKSEGIAHNSYFFGTLAGAAVIDPRRDVDVYIGLAQKYQARIIRIFETHRNEDFVSGSLELSRQTGADIFHGEGLKWGFGNSIKDGQEFNFGQINIRVIATPGHTNESVSYVLADLPSGKNPVMVFTGDTLFVDDVGRIDLYGENESSRLAGNMYDSIYGKLLPLGDSVIICPAHGAGSVCGLHIGSRDESTLGIERVQSPALRFANRNNFVRHKLNEHSEIPYYFARMEKLNLEGQPLLGKLPAPPPLSPSEFKLKASEGMVVIDTSMPWSFGGAHIKGSYSIWLDGLPLFAGWLIPPQSPILLVQKDPGHLDTAVRYLARASYDNIAGYLRIGIEDWYGEGLPIEHLALLSVHELKQRVEAGNIQVLDVRGQEEWETGFIEGSIHIYVGYLEKNLDKVPYDKPVAVVCNIGHRSSIAASILLRAGFTNVYNVLGSVKAWKAAGFPLQKELPAKEVLVNASGN